MIYRRRGSVSSGFLIIGIMMFFLAVSVSPVQGATFRVNDFSDAVDAINGDGVCETAPGNRVCTLRAAIQEANALAGRDVVILKRGIYLLTIGSGPEDLGAEGDLDITEDLVLKGKGAKKTFINGNRLDRVLQVIGAEVVIKDLTIQNGLATVDFPGAEGAGGGIANSGGAVTIVRCAIANNMAQGAGASFGGGIANLAEGSLVIRDSVVSNNSALGDGGEARGGGIYSASVTLVIRNSTIADNQAMASGGGVSGGGLWGRGGEISGSTISGNVASSASSGASGGGMLMDFDSVVSNCRISGNRAISVTGMAHGGGAYFSTGSIIGNSTFSDNSATGVWGYGGGIFFSSLVVFEDLILRGSTFTRNAATTWGGGIYVEGVDSVLTIEQGSRIIRNLAGVEGGGVYRSGSTVNVSNDSVVKHNSPDDTNF